MSPAERAASRSEAKKQAKKRREAQAEAKCSRSSSPPRALPGVLVTAAGATCVRGELGVPQSGTAEEEPPRKLSRYEAMWTDCDPEQWEYVVV
jgi:hypothetical protein